MYGTEFSIFDHLPLLTDFPSRKHWEAAVWQILIERLIKLPQEDVLSLLLFLLSEKERSKALYRALTASRLRNNISLREIGRELWLTRQTISAIKKSLKEGEYKSSAVRGHKMKEYTTGAPRKNHGLPAIPTFMGEVRRQQREPHRRKFKR